jgi:two-component system, response regulator PdtaR
MATILVADDDGVVLFTLAEGLRRSGFTVIEARDGIQALSLCNKVKIDLALLDIRMPGLDGIELARHLRDETTVPVVFLSAFHDDELVQRAVSIGAMGYLTKPLNLANLSPTIRTALARSEERRKLRAALESNRTIATAVGILMQSRGLNQAAAFAELRSQSRSQRRKLEDIAKLSIESASKPRIGSG